jgi:hypothetical protein
MTMGDSKFSFADAVNASFDHWIEQQRATLSALMPGHVKHLPEHAQRFVTAMRAQLAEYDERASGRGDE